MKEIINETSRADVTFMVEGKPVHAHRCILYARCRTLEEKVKQSGRKSDERDKAKWGINHPNHLTLDVPTISYKAFIGFMEYLYTDKIRSLKTN